MALATVTERISQECPEVPIASPFVADCCADGDVLD